MSSKDVVVFNSVCRSRLWLVRRPRSTDLSRVPLNVKPAFCWLIKTACINPQILLLPCTPLKGLNAARKRPGHMQFRCSLLSSIAFSMLHSRRQGSTGNSTSSENNGPVGIMPASG